MNEELFRNLMAAMFAKDATNNCDSGRYEEILRLDQLLNQANIPHELHNHLGGFQIAYYGTKGKPEAKPGVISGAGVGTVCSAVENPYSYGHEDDRIEIIGLLTDEEYDVAGGLTADEVFERIRRHWIDANKNDA